MTIFLLGACGGGSGNETVSAANMKVLATAVQQFSTMESKAISLGLITNQDHLTSDTMVVNGVEYDIS